MLYLIHILDSAFEMRLVGARLWDAAQKPTTRVESGTSLARESLQRCCFIKNTIPSLK